MRLSLTKIGKMQVALELVQLPTSAMLINVVIKRCCTALISKFGVNFWKCWRSKFEKANKTSRLIDGLYTQIAEKFADFFPNTCTSFNEGQSNRLRTMFNDRPVS